MSITRIFISLNFLLITLANYSYATDVAGGVTKTAVNAKKHSYEMALNPTYTFSSDKGDGGYLAGEFRNQASEDVAVGASFGAGEAGFHIGGHGIYYLLPDVASQPALALLGGVYINRRATENFFVVKFGPIVSKSFKVEFGHITPYASASFTPAMNLGSGGNRFGIKGSVGSQFAINSLKGINLWLELGLGLLKNDHEIVVGVSYPFVLLGT